MPHLLSRIAVIVASGATASAAVAQSATFTYAAPFNGQEIQQRFRTHSNLVTTFEQSGQVISSEPKNVVISQVRDLVVLESHPERIARVRVTYAKAERRDLSDRLSPPAPQSVLGHTYLVQRPNAEAELVVTYQDGSTPTPDEVSIVKSNMQAVGKANPLAKFLNGRTIRVGERVVMPSELAADLLGATLARDVENVALTLKKLRQVESQAAAVFEATIVGADGEQGSPAFSAQGEMVISIATCRTLRLDMDAKVSVTETRGPENFTFNVRNDGRVEMEVEASYAGREN